MSLSLSEKTGRLFFIGLPSASLDDETKTVLETIRPGAIILFVRNIESPEQVAHYTDSINSFLGYKPVFCIDQEGGIVSRFRKGFAVAPGAMAVSATNDPGAAYETGLILGKEMRAVGITWDLAPVVDVNSLPQNPGIGVRSYGDTPQRVIEYAGQFIKGLHQAHVSCCLKHFPGLGRVDVDPHLGRPVVNLTKAELLKEELKPYIDLEAEAFMPSHAFYTALQTVDEPASLSKEVLMDLARKELGYKGILVADALGMGGVTQNFSAEQAALAALANGMDFLSFCHNSEEQMQVFRNTAAAVEKDETLARRTEESFARVSAFIERANSGKAEPLSSAGSPEHISAMKRIAAAGITSRIAPDCPNRQNRESIPDPSEAPADFTKNVAAVFSVRLTRQVEVEEGSEDRSIPQVAKDFASSAGAPLYTFSADCTEEEQAEAEAAAKKALSAQKRLVIFTEDALIHPGQKKLLQTLCALSPENPPLVVALRNPYDPWICGVKQALISYGYERISQQALFDVLTGKEPAPGKLPVKEPGSF